MTLLQKKGVEGLRWTIVEDADEKFPPPLLVDPTEFLQNISPQSLIKESPVRMALIIAGPRGDLFLKRYKLRGVKEGLKYLIVPSKARREWQTAHRALRKGIPTPMPLAMAERRKRRFLKDALLITQAVFPSSPLIELISEGGQKDLFFRAAGLLRKIHEAGLFHQDLHAGNILVGMEEKKLYLIDLHRSRFVRSVSKQKRLWNLAQFLSSLRGSLSAEDKKAFLQRYDDEKDIFKEGLEAGLKKIEMFENRIHRRHMKSRTKRCLKNSSGFFVVKEGNWRIWARRGWEPQQLLKIIARHKDIVVEGKEGLIKEDRRTAITLFDFMKKRICVKEYRSEGALSRFKELFRRSKAWKGWLMGNGLVVRGIAGITPLALVERRRWGFRQEAFLLMESPPDYRELRSYIQETFGNPHLHTEKKKAFIKALAAFMAGLYNLKIAHRDLKINNILVKENGNGWCFALTDWEDIGLDKEISGKRLIKGLIQMNTSTPLYIRLKDRLRFLKAYFALIERADTGAVSREVGKESEKRGWATFT